MSFASLGDRSVWGYDKPPRITVYNSLIIVVFGPVCVVSQLIYLYFNYKDLTFDTLGIMFSIFPATCLANVNIMCARMKAFKRVVKQFLSSTHLYNAYKEGDEFVKQKLITIERLTRWTSYYLIFFFTMNWVGWISIPAINNYRNEEQIQNRTIKLQTCVFMWMPFDYAYNYQNWLVIHLINVYIVAGGVFVMMLFQSLNYMCIYNLLGHIQMLKNMMKNDFTVDLSDQEVKRKLINLIEYHTFITKVFDDVQEAFGINVAANYLQNLLGNSVIMYQLMYGGRENILLYIVMIMAYTGGPILMSFVLEEIRRQTDDLPDVVYSMPWEDMSLSNQKTLILILQHVQIILDFKALGGLRAGVRPMMSILKTTFSYYVMLETSMAKDE